MVAVSSGRFRRPSITITTTASLWYAVAATAALLAVSACLSNHASSACNIDGVFIPTWVASASVTCRRRRRRRGGVQCVARGSVECLERTSGRKHRLSVPRAGADGVGLAAPGGHEEKAAQAAEGGQVRGVGVGGAGDPIVSHVQVDERGSESL